MAQYWTQEFCGTRGRKEDYRNEWEETYHEGSLLSLDARATARMPIGAASRVPGLDAHLGRRGVLILVVLAASSGRFEFQLRDSSRKGERVEASGQCTGWRDPGGEP